MNRRSQRPKEAIVKKKRLNFRINRSLTAIYNFFSRSALSYNALSSDESLRMLLDTKKSLIRFGNGESEIMVGLDMATQEYSKDLAESLGEIVRAYCPDSSYLLALTNWNLQQSVRELKATPRKEKFRLWRYMRYIFWRHGMGKSNMPYLETDMFRSGPVGLQLGRIEKLWADRPRIIVVHNTEKYFQWFSRRYPEKKMYFIPIPDKNFFSVLGEVQDRVLSVVKENGIRKDDLLIMVSAGPGADVLCYNLCQKEADYLCYDMGNFFHMHYGE